MTDLPPDAAGDARELRAETELAIVVGRDIEPGAGAAELAEIDGVGTVTVTLTG